MKLKVCYATNNGVDANINGNGVSLSSGESKRVTPDEAAWLMRTYPFVSIEYKEVEVPEYGAPPKIPEVVSESIPEVIPESIPEVIPESIPESIPEVKEEEITVSIPISVKKRGRKPKQ